MTENEPHEPEAPSKVAALKSVSPIGMAQNSDGFLQSLVTYVVENDLIDLEGEWLNDVELIGPEPGEVRLGQLSLFESHMFGLAHLSQTIIQDIMLEAQAQTAETTAKLLRQQKHGQHEIQIDQHAILTEDDRIYMNQLSMVFHLASSSYQFSLRARFNCFDAMIFIRNGFVAYKST